MDPPCYILIFMNRLVDSHPPRVRHRERHFRTRETPSRYLRSSRSLESLITVTTHRSDSRNKDTRVFLSRDNFVLSYDSSSASHCLYRYSRMSRRHTIRTVDVQLEMQTKETKQMLSPRVIKFALFSDTPAQTNYTPELLYTSSHPRSYTYPRLNDIT